VSGPPALDLSDQAQLAALLRLMIEWGADEALAPAAIDRFARADAALRMAPPPEGISTAAGVSPAALGVRPLNPPSAVPTAVAVATPMHQAEQVAAAAETIEQLRAALAGFTGCGLAATAGSLVFADGNPASGLVLIGEAPGAEEDRAGKPFVGASGRLLDRMLASIGLDRTQCLITNIIPWRPPGNRNPTDNEVLVCLPFLYRHLALVRPQRIVLMGAMATRALTGRADGIRKLRGRWIDIAVPGLAAPVPALPMLHPAYLLRQPGAKRDAWTDLVTLKRTLSI